jgi:hypothetical protein
MLIAPSEQVGSRGGRLAAATSQIQGFSDGLSV